MAQAPVKVMMVDDDEDDFIIVRDLLRDVGAGKYALTWVSQYDQALRQVCSTDVDVDVDVVLADYQLGSRSGIELVRDLLANGCKAPVIVLTGQGDREVDFAAMEAGAADFLNKSQLTADMLERTIRYAVAQKKSEEQRLSLVAERAARAELEAAAKAKDEFLAMLSHELRTPLTPVLMTVSALEADSSLPQRVREDVAVIRRNVELQVKLIDDLLDLTRVARGKFELKEELTDVHALVRQAWQTCCGDSQRLKGLRTVHKLDARRHHVWGDPARLEQVFWNLFKNAMKFTPDGGTIEVATENPDWGGVTITVRDTGVGIEPDALPHIFTAFEQGGRDVTKQFGGLGLGLAICKAVTEMHGGTIGAHSDGQDQGAVFTVTLPVTAAPAPTLTERGLPAFAGGAQPGGNGKNLTPEQEQQLSVLLVEDNAVTLRVMSRLFRDFGYDVTPAPDVSAARTAAQAKRFDLVVSDLGLPDGSGLELMRELRDRYGLRGIALSGYGQAQDVLESRQAGFVEHLVKPIDFKRLEAAVRRVSRDHST
jgi:signal transduction histidine kinase